MIKVVVQKVSSMWMRNSYSKVSSNKESDSAEIFVILLTVISYVLIVALNLNSEPAMM